MIIRLDTQTPDDASFIGGKGMGLLRLIRAQLPVPDAWCIPASISTDPAARTACVDGALGEWWDQVAEPGSLWAVRSSAISEDLEDASFAGVYETVLGVDTVASLRAAVCRCWESLDQQRAQVYRGTNRIDDGGGIALIVQRMLRPEAAGVLLTTNPLRPFASEIAIDSSWGLGEAVVSGRTDPDHFVLDRESGEIREQRLGAKQLEVVWKNGIHDSAVDTNRRAEFSLDSAQLKALHQLAITVTEQIGPRRDIEWAIADGTLHVLQDRPITNLPSDNPTDVWSRRFGDEYLAECSLPLPADLMLPWITEAAFDEMAVLQGRRDLADKKPVRMHQGYAYFSGDYYAEGLRMLPRKMRTTSASNWFPAIVEGRAHDVAWNPLLLAGALLAPMRDSKHSGLAGNLVALEKHCATIEAEVVPLLAQDYDALDLTAWHDQFDAAENLGREHFRVIRWGMSVYNPFLHAILEKTLKSWCDDESGALYQDLISGLDDTRTAAINREIGELAETIVADDALSALVRGGAGYAAARADSPDSSFWSSYDDFVARHGHRSDSRDIAKPRWSEEPQFILEFVRAQLRARDAGVVEVVGAARRRRADAEAVALGPSLGNAITRRIRKPLLQKLIDTVQAYTRYRENQRYHLDYLITHMRSLVLAQARGLVKRGELADIDDVFLLTGREFFAAIGGGNVVADLDERRAEYARNRSRVPATYLFDDVETEVDDESTADADLPSGALAGAGVCRGKAKGPARVVHTLADLGRVEAGDILVAPNIDPGWTSVFPLLSGLVIETGGTLSHGAILAREYSCPAVSGVNGATVTIENGALIEVDGNAGWVLLPT